MKTIGVDPGLHGALCLLYDMDGIPMLDVADMPVCDGRVDGYALTGVLSGWGRVDAVAVEEVHAMPKQGVSSTFTFGMGYGVVLGVLAALERPVVHVRPTAWTKALGVGADKEAHRRRAKETWPAYADLFARKGDGRYDAALIAEYARRLQIQGVAA